MKRDLIETYKVLTVKEKSDRDKFLYWVKTTIISVDTCSSCISLEVVSTSGNSSTVNVWWMHGTICQATSLKLEIVMTYILVKSVSESPLLLQLQFWILQFVFIPRWFQSTCCKFIHWDATTGADTWRDEAVNRYQQQQQVIEAETVITFKNRLRHPYIYKFK